MSDIWGDILGVVSSTATGALAGSAASPVGTVVGGVVGLATGLYGAIAGSEAESSAKKTPVQLPQQYDPYMLKRYSDLQATLGKIRRGTDATTIYGMNNAGKGLALAMENLAKISSTPAEAAQNMNMAQTGYGETVKKIVSAGDERSNSIEGLLTQLGVPMGARSYEAQKDKMAYDTWLRAQNLKEAAGQKEANMKGLNTLLGTVGGLYSGLKGKGTADDLSRVASTGTQDRVSTARELSANTQDTGRELYPPSGIALSEDKWNYDFSNAYTGQQW